MPKISRLSYLLVLFFVFLLSAAPLQAQTTPAVDTYDQLLQALRQTRQASEARISEFATQEKVREAWEMGRLIDEHILKHKAADYDRQVIHKLKKDLGFNDSELYYRLRFARMYSELPTYKLSWSHYRALLALKDAEDRKKFSELAVSQNWAKARLIAEIQKYQAGEKIEDALIDPVLVAKPGKLYTYRVRKAAHGPLKNQLVLELGFGNYYQPETLRKFKEGELVTLEKGKLKRIDARSDALFTYSAQPIQVIDGDTFTTTIDLGFKVITHQKLRLRGIDAPELVTEDGVKAKKFLEETFRKGQITLRALRPDKYGRYLADVFVTSSKNEQIYVNQEIIAQGFASVMEG